MKTKQLLRYFLFVCVFAMGTISAFAQEQKITGKVTNQRTGAPIPNVTVKVKNGTQSVLTNEEGVFTIKAPSSESIISISHVGFSVWRKKPVLVVSQFQLPYQK